MDRHSSYSAPRSERASVRYGGNRGRSTKRNTYNKRSWNDNRKLHYPGILHTPLYPNQSGHIHCGHIQTQDRV